jgi:hypothetical protein
MCRSFSPHSKVLATACSNVGADNLALRLQAFGLKVVRIGRPSAVNEALWDHTLDALIDRDPDAQAALRNAARATAALNNKSSKRSRNDLRSALGKEAARDLATAAVKASIKVRPLSASLACCGANLIIW